METNFIPKCVESWNTPYNVDCIEFCPVYPYKHLFIIGTYELSSKLPCTTSESCNEIHKPTQTRNGGLYLMSYQQKKIQLLDNINLPGVLDVRWSVHTVQEKILLGAVDATGMLLLYSLNEIGNKLLLLSSVLVTTGIALYLDFSNRLECHSPLLIIVSDSLGSSTLVSFNEDLQIVKVIKCHDFENWVTTFNWWNPNIIYSGGDDCKLKSFDTRCDPTIAVSTSRLNDGGVTSIQSSIHQEDIIVTGSYDQQFKVLDNRNLKREISTTDMGGGVWRLRWKPYGTSELVSSCMHDGFKVINMEDSSLPKVTCRYDKHQSLAYGADWCWNAEKDTCLIGSVSFYDNFVSLWRPEASSSS